MELIKSNQNLKILKILALVFLGSIALTISAKLKILKSIQVKNLIRRVHKIGLFKMERKNKKGKSKF